MSTDVRVRVGKVRMMLTAIHRELVAAIALAENFGRCANSADLLDRLNETPEGASFAAIRDAIHMTLVQTLMRLNDWHKDASSIPNVIRTLSDPQVMRAVKAEATMGHLDIDAQMAAIEAIRQGDDYKACLAGARNLRDQYIAHAEFDPDDHGAKWGQERRLLDYTIQIAKHLEVALTSESRDEDYLYWQEFYRESAGRLWSHVALPSKDDEDDEDVDV